MLGGDEWRGIVCGRPGCLCGVGGVVVSVVLCAVWDVACCVRRNNGGNMMIAVTAHCVLSLGTGLLSGGGVKLAFQNKQCEVTVEFITCGV